MSVLSTSELESSPISFAAVDRTPLQLSLLSKVSIYNLTGKKEKMAGGVGGDYSKEAINRGTAIIRGNTVSPQSRGICTDVCMVEVVGGGGGTGAPTIEKSKISGPDRRVEQYLRSLRTYLLYT